MPSDTGLNRAELQKDKIRSIAFLAELKKKHFNHLMVNGLIEISSRSAKKDMPNNFYIDD